MIVRPDIISCIAAEEPKATIVSPGTMGNRMAHEMIEAINPIPAVLRIVQCVANFVGQLRRDPLVRIEYENPLVRRLRNGPILELAAHVVIALDDPAAE